MGAKKQQIAFFCIPGLENFIRPIAGVLPSSEFEVKECYTQDRHKIVEAVKWADTCWLEWANELAVEMTSDMALLNQRRVIVRLHSYEAFDLNLLSYIDWTRVNDLIFVSKYVKEMAIDKVPKIEHLVNRIHVIPNGVDIHRFAIRGKKQPGNRIAYVGYVNHKKTPPLLLQAMWAIPEKYFLHMACQFQDERYERYLRYYLDSEPRLRNRIMIDGWQEDVASWLQDKQYVLSTSPFESQGMGIMEGMACGLRPLIHDFPGAQDIYPAECLWRSVGELGAILEQPLNPTEYRRFVKGFYSMDGCIREVVSMLLACEQRDTGGIDLGAKSPTASTTVSLAMMVKNEERNLDKCLSSVKDWVDEIVVVDTGSTDRTIEICKSFGATVSESPWRDDFSFHRNESLAAANGEWILVMDPDEEFVGDGDELKHILAQIPSSITAVCVELKDMMPDGSVAVSFRPIRLFRKGHGHYTGIVHNEPHTDGRVGACEGVAIRHYGYHAISEDLMAGKLKRSLALLHKQLSEQPGNLKTLFYLFETNAELKEYDLAVEYGFKYISCRDKAPNFNTSIYFSLASVLIALKRYHEAFRVVQEGLRVCPGDLDLSTSLVELGVATKDRGLIMQGASQFSVAYHYFTANPGARDGKFVYNLRPESFAYIMHHKAMAELQSGLASVEELTKAAETLPSGIKEAFLSELRVNLDNLGITSAQQ